MSHESKIEKLSGNDIIDYDVDGVYKKIIENSKKFDKFKNQNESLYGIKLSNLFQKIIYQSKNNFVKKDTNKEDKIKNEVKILKKLDKILQILK